MVIRLTKNLKCLVIRLCHPKIVSVWLVTMYQIFFGEMLFGLLVFRDKLVR